MRNATGNPAPGIISDLLLWMALAALLIVGFSAWRASQPHGEVLHLQFHDANEITRGSMVHMMGTEIGYVDKVEIRQDHVDLVVRTYPDALPVASGSTASILFTGLAGSKSIEIIPPKVPRPLRDGQKRIFTEEPIRLKDNFDYQINVTRALQKGAENISDFFGKKKSVEELQFNIQTADRKLANADRLLTYGHQNIQGMEAGIHRGLKDINDTAADMNSAALAARRITHPEQADDTIGRVLNGVMLGFLESQAVLVGMQMDQTVDKLNNQTAHISGHVAKSRLHLDDTSLERTLSRIEGGSEAFYRGAERAETWRFTQSIPALQQARLAIQAWGARIAQWTERLSQEKAPPAPHPSPATGVPSAPNR